MWTSCVAVVAAMIMRICDQRAGNAAFLRKWNHLERNYSIIWKKIKSTFTARQDRDDWMPPANRTKYDLVRWSRFGVYKYSRDVCVCCDRSIYSKHHKHHFTVNILPEIVANDSTRMQSILHLFDASLCGSRAASRAADWRNKWSRIWRKSGSQCWRQRAESESWWCVYNYVN